MITLVVLVETANKVAENASEDYYVEIVIGD
jgi:hypothetical protein